MMNLFYVEVTDTYGEDANYCWVKRYKVHAKSIQGAIGKVSRDIGYSFRKAYDSGDIVRYNAQHACICAFVQYLEEEDNQYTMKTI